MKMNEAIESFLLYIKTERRLSDKTVIKYEGGLRQFEQFIADTFSIINVEEIKPTEIREWQVHLSDRGNAVATVKGQLVILRSFYKYLRRQGIINVDVMAKVVTPKMPKHLPIFYTEKETAKIYDSMYFSDDFEGHRDQLMLQVLYETGIRRAEVVGMTESSVDFSAKTLKVLGKRDKERIIPLENELLHNIKCYFSLKKQKDIQSEFFFVRSDGKQFTANDVYRVVKKYMTLFSKADKISPHIFRHSFATHMLNEGADIGAIKELLGHTDLSATEIYTHVTRQHIKEEYQHAHPRTKK
jgi:integrase/recombinase XerC